MWKRLRRWWKAGTDLVHLQGLDARLLADMGLDHDTLRPRVMARTPPPDSADPPRRPERALAAARTGQPRPTVAVKVPRTIP
jgi:hypothetical protein